jgi:anhydro-N-acetylmuramic acid kinase
MKARRVVGCMTGTSIDALDAALIEWRGTGLAARVRLLRCGTYALGAALRDGLRRAARQEPLSAGALARLAAALARRHVRAVQALCGARPPDLIAAHGQTIFHAPPLSWQLFDAAPVARHCRAPVIYDLRAADLAAGGQGAPITPLADFMLFRDPREARVLLNLGGFANFTWLPAVARKSADLAEIRGGDLCACNQLLDHAARRWLKRPLDRDGRTALRGMVSERLLAWLIDSLSDQPRARRSLGTQDERCELIARIERRAARLRPADRLRTLCAALAQTIADALPGADRVLAAGGGVHNRALLDELRARCRTPLVCSDTAGIPAGYREAIAMAVLGALSQDGVPITLPRVTRVPSPAPLAGVWCDPRPRTVGRA